MLPPVPGGEARELWAAGSEAYRQGDFSGSVELYSSALHLRPGDARLLCNRSAALLGMGLVQEALEDATACLRLHPGCAKAHVRAALALREEGRHVEAVDHLSHAQATDTHNTEIATLLSTTNAEHLYHHSISNVDSPARSPSRSPAYYDRVRASVPRERPHAAGGAAGAGAAGIGASSPAPVPACAGGPHRITTEDGTTFTSFFTSPRVSGGWDSAPVSVPAAAAAAVAAAKAVEAPWSVTPPRSLEPERRPSREATQTPTPPPAQPAARAQRSSTTPPPQAETPEAAAAEPPQPTPTPTPHPTPGASWGLWLLAAVLLVLPLALLRAGGCEPGRGGGGAGAALLTLLRPSRAEVRAALAGVAAAWAALLAAAVPRPDAAASAGRAGTRFASVGVPAMVAAAAVAAGDPASLAAMPAVCCKVGALLTTLVHAAAALYGAALLFSCGRLEHGLSASQAATLSRRAAPGMLATVALVMLDVHRVASGVKVCILSLPLLDCIFFPFHFCIQSKQQVKKGAVHLATPPVVTACLVVTLLCLLVLIRGVHVADRAAKRRLPQVDVVSPLGLPPREWLWIFLVWTKTHTLCFVVTPTISYTQTGGLVVAMVALRTPEPCNCPRVQPPTPSKWGFLGF